MNRYTGDLDELEVEYYYSGWFCVSELKLENRADSFLFENTLDGEDKESSFGEIPGIAEDDGSSSLSIETEIGVVLGSCERGKYQSYLDDL